MARRLGQARLASLGPPARSRPPTCCATAPVTSRRWSTTRNSPTACGSPGLRRLHTGDTLTPLDPLTIGDRLRAAGFVDADVAVLAFGLRFRARTPL